MQKIYVIRGQYPKYAKNSKNSTSKQTNKQVKKNPNPKQPNQTMGGGCEETFPKKTNTWLIGTGKDAHH